jgi:plastocyanin
MIAAFAALCAALVPHTLQGQPAPAGAVAGHVTLTSHMRGVPIGTNAYASRAITHQAPPASPEMRSVVVYLKDIAVKGAVPTSHAQIRQENESFVPRVVAITRGSTVDFPNFDPYFHNVFSLSGAATFDLGRYPDGQSRSRQFTRAGIVKVYCHIHSQMSATILVLDHPYFTTPDENGDFALQNVPPGTYTLVAWHERVGEQTTRIRIAPNQTITADLSLPVGDAR